MESGDYNTYNTLATVHCVIYCILTVIRVEATLPSLMPSRLLIKKWMEVRRSMLRRERVVNIVLGVNCPPVFTYVVNNINMTVAILTVK